MGIVSDLDALAAANAANEAATEASVATWLRLSNALGVAIAADDTETTAALAAELATAVTDNPAP